MTEELKATRGNDYFNVAQSDIRALVRGELNSLKTTLTIAKAKQTNPETKFHYLDALKRIETILNPK